MALTPTLEVERSLWQSGRFRIAGVDEAGMGSLAGPVVAAAVLVPLHCCMIPGVRDSKLLSARQREALDVEIRRRALAVAVGAASVAEIERLNIRRASHVAMARALRRIGQHDHALIDGRAISSFDPGRYTAIVDGDASCYAIACASIVAKVARDALMHRLSARYPTYGWERNAGYGTPEHLAALQRCGVTPLHRRTYAPVQAALGDGDGPAG